jgi:signal transduction histidine kinase
MLTSLKHPLADGTIAKPLEYQSKAKAAVLAARGEEGIIEAEDYRGVPVLAAYRYIPISLESGWGLVVKRDKAELFASLRNDLAYSMLTGLLGIIFVVVLTFVLSRHITVPIRSLSRVARKVSEGDFDARAPVTTSDEVGQLATVFNSMTQRLKGWYEELDEQVKIRTEELRKEIVERKRAEEEIRLLQETILEVSESDDLDSAIAVVLRKVCDATGWAFGEAWVPSSDGACLECSLAWYGSGEGLEAFRRASEGFSFTPGVGLPGRTWSSRQSEWMKDATDDETFRRVELAREAGLKAGVAIPVIAGEEGDVVAVMVFYVPEAREVDERFIQILSAASAELGSLMRRIRAEVDVRKHRDHLEALVEERTTELQAVNQELEAFNYSVSHDLRAPLRSIDGFSKILLEDCEDQLDAQGRDYLRRVGAATQRMGIMIDDLLDLSKVTRAEMRREIVDLSALAKTISAELQQAEPDREVTFLIAEGLVANGDAKLLHLVLENLLGNAWKFTRKHPQATIEFAVVQDDGQPTYVVRDNGAGFDMTYADKLFGPFQRLHRQEDFEGTGVGLATVQRIISRHGGEVWGEGEVDKGATFYFTLA